MEQWTNPPEKKDQNRTERLQEEAKKKVYHFFVGIALSLGIGNAQAAEIAKVYAGNFHGTAFTVRGLNRCLLGTAFHLVNKAPGRKGTLAMKGKKYSWKQVVVDSHNDMAIIEVVDSKGNAVKNCDPNPFVLSNFAPGQKVVAKGYPGTSVNLRSSLGLSELESKNILSKHTQYKGNPLGGVKIDEKSKPVVPGMSGGPVVMQGTNSVSGVVVASNAEKKVGFLAPADKLKQLLQKVK